MFMSERFLFSLQFDKYSINIIQTCPEHEINFADLSKIIEEISEIFIIFRNTDNIQEV